MKLVFACLLVVACGKDDGPRTPPPSAAPVASPECAKAIAPFLDHLYAILAKSPAAQTPNGGARIAKTRPQLEPALLAECTTRKWPQAYLTCIATPKSDEEMEACDRRLSPDARDRGAKIVDGVLEPVIKQLMPSAPPPPPPKEDEEQ